MKFEDIKIGYQGTFTRTITEELNRQFGEVIQDFNPVHFDEKRMKKTFLGKRVTNGILTDSLIAVAAVKMFASNESVPIGVEKKIRFVAPVYIGDTITATVTVKEKYDKQKLLCKGIVKKQDETIVMEADYLLKILNV